MKNVILLIVAIIALSSCAGPDVRRLSENSEIPMATQWFESFERRGEPPLTSASLSWLEEKKEQAEHLPVDQLFEMPFTDRMTILLLRRAFYLGANPLPFDGASLGMLLFKDPRLKGWLTPQIWGPSRDSRAYALKKDPEQALLFLTREGDRWNLDLVQSLQVGLRPFEVKYSRLGAMGMGMALNLLALQGEKGVGEFLLTPLKP